MPDYLSANAAYWSGGYAADHVESHVFRPFGRILRPELGLTGERGERLLDFACGQGASMAFFRAQGFAVHGVDINEPDLEAARRRLPGIEHNLARIDPKPRADDVFFGGDFDLVISVQALYYLSEPDLDVRLESLWRQMRPGAAIYATMMGTRHHFFEHATPAADGMHRVDYDGPRVSTRDYHVLFTESREQLRARFHRFDPLHVGYYDARFREDEGSQFHWTFVGRKAG